MTFFAAAKLNTVDTKFIKICIGYNRGKGFSTKRHFSLMTQSSTVLHCIMVFYRVKVILYCVSHLAVCVQPCR